MVDVGLLTSLSGRYQPVTPCCSFVLKYADLLAPVLVLLLALHLLCMNVCSAGPLVCVWLNRKASPAVAKQCALKLAWASYWALVFGILAGITLGTLAWYSGDRKLVETLPLFRSKVNWGMAELLCSLAWTLGYWTWLKRRPPIGFAARFAHAGLALLTATNLLYHFPPLMTVMSKVAAGEIEVTSHVNSSAYRALIYTPNVMAHTLHIWIASFAVTGVYIFYLARKLDNPIPVFVTGARISLLATLAQIGSDLWLLVVVPPHKQSLLLGGNLWETGLLLLSMLAAFQLLQLLATLALGDYEDGLPKRIFKMMVVTVVLMSGTLHVLRG